MSTPRVVSVFAVPVVRQRPSAVAVPPPEPLAPPPPPPPPPPQRSIEDVISELPSPAPAAEPAGLSLENPTVHEIVGFRWQEPMPPDGELNERDDEGNVIGPNVRHEDEPFNDDYFREQLAREAVVQADQVYQFVQLVAGFTGMGATAEQYWRASETGGRAVHAILDNLGDLARGPGGGSDDRADKGERAAANAARRRIFEGDARKKDLDALVANAPLASAELQQRAAAILKNGEQLKALAKAGNAKGAEGGETLLGDAVSKEFLRSLASSGASASSMAEQEYQRALDGQANAEAWLQAKINSEQAVLVRTLASLQAISTPAQRQASESQIRREHETRLQQARQRAERMREYERKRPAAASAAAPPGQPAGDMEMKDADAATVRLTDGTYVDDANNAELMLLRMMFRPDGRSINAAELQAWDALYYDGRFFETRKNEAKKAASGGGASRELKEIRERLELEREISRVLRRDSSGIEWRKTPTNVGLLFLTPPFVSALKMAYERVRKVCGKEWVPLVDLMTHDQVHVYFARLVSYEIAEQQYQFPGRNMTVAFGQQAREDRARLLHTFLTLERDSDGYLYFGSAHSASQDYERRATEANRKRYLERTGRYFSDRYEVRMPHSPAASAPSSLPYADPPVLPPRIGVYGASSSSVHRPTYGGPQRAREMLKRAELQALLHS